MTTTATKTKTRKVDELCPPADVRDNTKARRAWCAARVAENTKPGRSAKVIGKGSYETVAVYEHVEVEGRERFRGTCQVCGGAQVVDGGVLVLHGYNRPGYGYVVGRCPGVAEVPLQVSDALTRKLQGDAQVQLASAELELERAKAEAKRLHDVLYPNRDGKSVEPTAHANAPKMQRARWWEQATEAEQAAHDALVAEWAKVYPMTAAYGDAANYSRAVESDMHKVGGWLRHLTDLLALNLVGTPLQREVVA